MRGKGVVRSVLHIVILCILIAINVNVSNDATEPEALRWEEESGTGDTWGVSGTLGESRKGLPIGG